MTHLGQFLTIHTLHYITVIWGLLAPGEVPRLPLATTGIVHTDTVRQQRINELLWES